MRKFYILMLTTVFAFSANAQFSGAYAPANWTLTSASVDSDASVDTTNAPNSIIFNGNDSNVDDCCELQDDYTVTVPTTGYISFTYDFVNNDEDELEEFYYLVNGTETLITSTSANGTITNIAVSNGDNFGFRIYTDDDCCGAGIATISNFSFSTTLSTNENDLLSTAIKLYPSATKDIFTLEYNGHTNLDSFSVYNTSGKLIKTTSLNGFDTTYAIDLKGLSNGVYLVSVASADGVITKKIII